ncbi:Antitoxin [Rubrivivax sp. A210]|uniref:type II toxin-antitoxin system Phd/YefM family antitoxin n=1 Tax=Rubrivivax sp. A210 TaxID=2772301 RepID=UPI00191A7723|nr:type II toxin-antitoxin system Phd/YefM family antitoxin [Rubrivivax sp. A210]CAD5371739.1 Antitoxin [Rubrivivax sp. A210]
MDSIPYSEVRAHLAETLKKLEVREEPVYISRRGEPAGVLMSVAQYQRLQSKADGPFARWLEWRTQHAKEFEAWKDEPDPWADVRDRTPPRPVTWTDDIADPEEP